MVGGSTGAGKSTLVNSLVGADVDRAGRAAAHHAGADAGVPARPTATGSPASTSCPACPAVTGERPAAASPARCGWSPSDALAAGLALLDAPDIDSVVTANRELAAQLLAAADLWLFVTTAARYADEVPWSFLRSARERSTALAVVLDRGSRPRPSSP